MRKIKIKGETEKQLQSLEELNADLLFNSMVQESRIEEAERQSASLTLELIMKGVL